MAETSEHLVLRDSAGRNQTIRKADLRERTNSALSLMPEGLEVGMSLEDFADLVAYLASLKVTPASTAK